MSEENNLQEKEKNINNNSKQSEQDNEKTVAILAYLLVGIIWFFTNEKLKKDEFAKFHVKQAMVLIITSICGSLILGMIPFLGWILLPFWSLTSFAFFVLGIINAAQNEKKEIPFIGTYSKLLKF